MMWSDVGDDVKVPNLNFWSKGSQGQWCGVGASVAVKLRLIWDVIGQVEIN